MKDSYSIEMPEHDHTSVEDALTAHLGREPLTDLCEQCGTHGRREKNTEIKRWPNNLVLHFKRLQWDRAAGRLRKNDKDITFEAILGIRNDIRYRLRGVIVHTGHAGGGHYTAFVRNREDTWFFCNDAQEPQHLDNIAYVMQAKPYMLFYER